MQGNYDYERNGDKITLNFDADKKSFRFKCVLDLKTKYGSVKMNDRYGNEYGLSIYKHVNDMVFCVIDNASKKENYVEHASYWHSFGNLFDKDSFDLESKITETIDVLIRLCKEQYEMFKKLD